MSYKPGDLAAYGRSEWLSATVTYMNECFALPSVPRVGEFAAQLGHSREWITRRFRRAVGKPPATVFRELQIGRAKALLGNTSEPTARIARAAAFGSQRAFYRTFRVCTGVSPSSYRRQHAGG